MEKPRHIYSSWSSPVEAASLWTVHPGGRVEGQVTLAIISLIEVLEKGCHKQG
jgi:hypothetical protein